MTEAPAGAAVPPFLATTAGWLWRLLVVAVAGWLAIAAARRLLLLLAPVAAAIVLTALLKPLADRLHRRGFLGSVATSAVLAGALLFVGGFVAVLTPRFFHEIDQWAQPWKTSSPPRRPGWSTAPSAWSPVGSTIFVSG